MCTVVGLGLRLKKQTLREKSSFRGRVVREEGGEANLELPQKERAHRQLGAGNAEAQTESRAGEDQASRESGGGLWALGRWLLTFGRRSINRGLWLGVEMGP